MEFVARISAASHTWFGPAWAEYLAYLAGLKTLFGAIPHQVITTAIWASLIYWAAKRYETPLTHLFLAIHKRVVDGSGLKFAGFEITPTPPAVVREHAIRDADEASAKGLQPESADSQDINAAVDPELPNAPPETSDTPADQVKSERVNEGKDAVRASGSDPADNGEGSSPSIEMKHRNFALAQYYQAEDFVLRLLQTEYGDKLKRQVTIRGQRGAIPVDAVIGDKNDLTVVDVHLAGPSSGVNLSMRLRDLLKRIEAAELVPAIRAIRQYVVYADGANPVKLQRYVEIAKSRWSALGTTIELDVQVFSMADLKSRFGVES